MRAAPLRILAVLLGYLAGSGCGDPPRKVPGRAGEGAIEIAAARSQAIAFVERMADGYTLDAVQGFTAALRDRLPASAVEAQWNALEQAHGRYRDRGDAEVVEQSASLVIVRIPLFFERGEARVQVVVDADRRIDDLQFQ